MTNLLQPPPNPPPPHSFWRVAHSSSLSSAHSGLTRPFLLQLDCTPNPFIYSARIYGDPVRNQVLVMRQWTEQTRKAWEWESHENTWGKSSPGRRTNKWEALGKQRVRNVLATAMRPVWLENSNEDGDEQKPGGRFTAKHTGHCKDVGFYWGRKSLGDFRQAWHNLIVFHRITLPKVLEQTANTKTRSRENS